ncbi:hypothetical protein FOA52_015048 [Chlamydomonas sp. UWO 241]|nr:hypothetical protein FOA52_015048 [Chlamydomonas sp. UWO 241]
MQSPSGTVGAASDVQHDLEMLMAAQASNGGCLFLKGESVPTGVASAAGIVNPASAPYSIVGRATIVTQMASDGPELRVAFGVPPEWATQTLTCCGDSQGSGCWTPAQTGSPPRRLVPEQLRMNLSPEAARDVLMAKPSPMRPATNQPRSVGAA